VLLRYFLKIVPVLVLTYLWLFSGGCTHPEVTVEADTLLGLTPQQQYLRNINLITDAFEKRGKVEGNQLLRTLDNLYTQKGTPTDRLIFRMCLLRYEMYLDSTQRNTARKMGHAMLKEAIALDNPFLIAKMHRLLGGHYYEVVHDYPKAFNHLLIMDKMKDELGREGYPEYDYDTYLMARSCYDFFDYDKAIRYAEKLMPVHSNKVTNNHIFNAALLGMSYLYQDRGTEARAVFQWAMDHLPRVFQNPKNLKLIGWTGIFTGNIGLTYYAEGKYDKAIPYLEQGLQITTATKYWNNVPRFGAKLALIYLARKDFAKAREYARYSIGAAWKMKPEAYPVARFVAEPYQIMSEYHQVVGQPQLALAYADSAQWAESAWKEQLDVALKQQAEFAIQITRHASSEALFQKEKENQILLRNFLLVLLALGGLMACLLYARRQLRKQQLQQQLEAGKQLAELELSHAQAQLRLMRQNALVNSQLLSTYDDTSGELVEISSPRHPESGLIREIQQQVILTDDDWTRFVQLFEKVYPGFFARLSFKLPDLTPAEVRFLALSRLGCSNREMAAMLGVGPGAIRQYRMRLRRKLHLPEHVEIEEMVAVI
jgi:DNA-binding CsgD family transcriptional regulator/tetratricopeptide (TPR) repeat protein